MPSGKRSPRGNWLERLTPTERDQIDAVSAWLRPIRWQWFVTLTFAWDVRGETAERHFKQYILNVQSELRDTVCYVAGMERASALGIPWHFHALLTAARPIPQRALRQEWWKLVGRGRRTPDNPDGDSVVAVAYSDERLGPEYCLKKMGDCEGEWLLRWLELFHPDIPRSGAAHEDRLRRRTKERGSI